MQSARFFRFVFTCIFHKEVTLIIRYDDIVARILYYEGMDVNEPVRAFFAKYLGDDSVDAYSLRTSDNALVTSFQVLMDYDGKLLFTQSMHLPVCSACDWDDMSTAKLKINLIEMSAEEFLGCEWTLTETAKALKDRLADIDLSDSSKYFSRDVEKCDLEK